MAPGLAQHLSPQWASVLVGVVINPRVSTLATCTNTKPNYTCTGLRFTDSARFPTEFLGLW